VALKANAIAPAKMPLLVKEFDIFIGRFSLAGYRFSPSKAFFYHPVNKNLVYHASRSGYFDGKWPFR
jgi:hypothetical protein